MTKQTLHAIASALIVISLILVVVGLPDNDLMWQLGLGVVGLAMLISLATRWAPEAKDSDEVQSRSSEQETSGQKRGS